MTSRSRTRYNSRSASSAIGHQPVTRIRTAQRSSHGRCLRRCTQTRSPRPREPYIIADPLQAVRDRAVELTRGPGSMIPVRFSGSAGGTSPSSVSGSERRTDRSRSTASVRANCSPVNPATKRPPRISPCASMRRSTGRRSRQGGFADSRVSRSRNSTPQRSSS